MSIPHRSVHVRSIQLPIYDCFEHLGVYAQSCGSNLLLIVIYRPGSENITNTFFDDFADLLERVAAYASPLLIVGDVNVHLDDETDSSTIKFQHLLAAHGLVQRVQTATHSGGHTLDVVITRDETQINLLHVDPPVLSDHSLIVGQLEATSLVGVDQVLCVRRRRWRSFDIDEFSHDLQDKVSLLMQSPPSECEVGKWFDVYDQLMRILLDKHAPMASVRTKRQQAAPWYDDDCRSAKSSLRKLEKRYRRLQTVESTAEWRCQSHVVRSLFQSKYSAYWSNVVKDCKGDCRALWTNINRLLRHQTTSTSSLNGDIFANHFRTKVDTIRLSTSGASRPIIEPRMIDSLTDFEVDTVDEITRLLRTLPAKQCGLDTAPTWIVKATANHIAPLLCAMCNASLKSAVMPITQKEQFFTLV